MREVDLLDHLEPVAPTETHGGGRPLADSVHREHGGALERRGEEGARGMALVMLGKEEPRLGIEPPVA